MRSFDAYIQGRPGVFHLCPQERYAYRFAPLLCQRQVADGFRGEVTAVFIEIVMFS